MKSTAWVPSGGTHCNRFCVRICSKQEREERLVGILYSVTREYPPSARIELSSMNRGLRKLAKNRSPFPNDESLAKLFYLALRNIGQKWTDADSELEGRIDPIRHSVRRPHLRQLNFAPFTQSPDTLGISLLPTRTSHRHLATTWHQFMCSAALPTLQRQLRSAMGIAHSRVLRSGPALRGDARMGLSTRWCWSARRRRKMHQGALSNYNQFVICRDNKCTDIPRNKIQAFVQRHVTKAR